jgi:dihydrofolate reductase
MRINIVVAMSRNGVIGRNGGLPWRLPADLKRFKLVTMGHPIVMGRKTHESIGRPLPGRQNIVVSRQPGYRVPRCRVVRSLNAALEAAGDVDEVMVVGGAALYGAALSAAGRIYLTEVQVDLEGDTVFPALDPAVWKETGRDEHGADANNEYDYNFVILDRK